MTKTKEQQDAVAAALSSFANQPGYRIFMAIADDLVTESEREALACEDEKKLIRLQRKARARREFLEELVRETSPQSQRSSEYIEVATD